MVVWEVGPGRWLQCDIVGRGRGVGKHVVEGILEEFIVSFEFLLPVIFFCDSVITGLF